MEVGHCQDVMANEHIAVGSSLHEKVKAFKYLGSLLTNQKSIHEEIKCRMYIIIQSKHFVFSTSQEF